MNSEADNCNNMFNYKMTDDSTAFDNCLIYTFDDDTSTNNSMSINESYLEILNNDLDPDLFTNNLYSESENLENYSSLYQGLSSLDNFKLMPINVKEKIINIMSKKRKRNNN